MAYAVQATFAAACPSSVRAINTSSINSSALTRPSLASSFRGKSIALQQRANSSKRRRSTRMVAYASGPNFFVELIESGLATAAVGAVVLATSEKRDDEIARIQTLDGALPFAAALAADTVAHSIPVLNVLLNLVTEPAGAAAGVAYLMTLVLSSPAVDPKTLAPAGTVLNAEKAKDVRASVRVPFTQIVPTALKVVDTSNEYSSGKGWATGPDGLPKLPITSVLIVLGVGGAILEFIAHAPVLGLFFPRLLTLAAWLAAVGALLDKRE